MIRSDFGILHIQILWYFHQMSLIAWFDWWGWLNMLGWRLSLNIKSPRMCILPIFICSGQKNSLLPARCFAYCYLLHLTSLTLLVLKELFIILSIVRIVHVINCWVESIVWLDWIKVFYLSFRCFFLAFACTVLFRSCFVWWKAVSFFMQCVIKKTMYLCGTSPLWFFWTSGWFLFQYFIDFVGHIKLGRWLHINLINWSQCCRLSLQSFWKWFITTIQFFVDYGRSYRRCNKLYVGLSFLRKVRIAWFCSTKQITRRFWAQNWWWPSRIIFLSSNDNALILFKMNV